MEYRITCPFCGWVIMHVKPSTEIRTQCPKCKESLWMKIEEKGICICNSNARKGTKDTNKATKSA